MDRRLLPLVLWPLLGLPAPAQLPTDPIVPRPGWFKVFAQGIPHGLIMPTCITFDAKGRLWASDLGGLILRLEDKNLDGVADIPSYQLPVSPAALPSLVGLCFVGGDLWVSYFGAIGVFKDANRDGDPDPNLLTVITNIPQSMHEVNQMVLGPDGWLYVSVGSLYNHAPGATSLATIWRFDPAAPVPKNTLQIYATGIRNSFDLVFDTQGNLLSSDNGRDDMGLELPFEELNQIVQGGFYGFPGDGPGTIPPIATYPAHSSPAGMLFYTHERFPGFAGTVLMVLYRTLPNFIAVGGPDRTRKVTRTVLTPQGSTFTGTVHDWVTGFGLGDPPLDLCADREGEIYLITHNPTGVPDARVYKLSHPWLKLEGTGQLGTRFQVRTWAKGGWAAFVLCGAPALFPIPTPLGDFLIDPRGIFSLGSGLAGGTDQFLLDLPIPNDPALLGAQVSIQALVGPLTSLNDMVLTNAKILAL